MKAHVLFILFLLGVEAWGQGLTTKNGVLIHDGKPFAGIGVNYFDAFYRVVRDPADTTYEVGFKELGRRHIPFCRIMCGGFWPVEQALYKDHPAQFFAGLDKVVACAERYHVGLILSMFWNPSTVPDLVREPVGAWGVRQSKTLKYMRQFVHDVVLRYRKSPTVWAWEFGNEYGLSADLPNAADHLPVIASHLGTPPSRTAADELLDSDLSQAYTAFAKEVRLYDPSRVIETGDSMLRDSAWHNREDKTWISDLPEQQLAVLRDLSGPASGVSVVSVHMYDQDWKRLPLYCQMSKTLERPLFVGEFGVEAKDPLEHTRFDLLLNAIMRMDQPFAALWVYDFMGQANTWNVTSTGSRSYQLDEIEAANTHLAMVAK